MIETIINIFRELARTHKTIKSFYYNKNYELGAGNEPHPLLWLEDPIMGNNVGVNGSVFSNSVNFSVLFVPDTEHTTEQLQSLAFSIGLNMIEKIKQDKESYFTIKPDWTYLTLSDYYDNNSVGCRFSCNLITKNISNLCLLPEQFDDNKQLEAETTLPDFDIKVTENGCETFTNKLPDFDIPVRR